MKYLLYLLSVTTLFSSGNFYYQQGKRVELTPLSLKEAKALHVKNSIRYFTTSTHHRVGVKDEVVFKLRENYSLEKLVQKYKLDDVKPLGGNFYRIGSLELSELFSLANRLYEDEATELAHPNFIRQRVRR